MKLRIISTVLLFSSLVCKANDPWTSTQIVMESAFQVSLLCDWRQTSDFHKYHIYESNGILGRHPSQAEINRWFLFCGMSHLIITNYLPSKYRVAWSSVSLAIEASVVHKNATGNIRVAVKF